VAAGGAPRMGQPGWASPAPYFPWRELLWWCALPRVLDVGPVGHHGLSVVSPFNRDCIMRSSQRALAASYHIAGVVSGAAAKQRPVGGQAEPGHTQQGARAPADPMP